MRYLILSLAILTLAACSSVGVDDVLPDKAVEYKREQQAERNLEIPPDLTSDRIDDKMSVPDNFGGVSTSYSEYVTDRQLRGSNRSAAVGGSVLPDLTSVEVRRDGDIRWLWVDAPVEDVWQRVADFWQENGLPLVEQDPTVGIMRTTWLENRAQIRDDFITNTIRRAFDGLYETGTRDQFRIRLERAPDDATELYLTHFGMEEQVVAEAAGKVTNTIWQPRERDPQLEAEMLRRIMVYLGAADEKARTQLAAARGQRKVARSELINTQGGVELRIDENFSRAWRLIGLALDRVGFAVEDRNRSAGIYYVRYNDPSRDEADEGWLSSLAFWSDDDDVDKVNRYQVRVGSEPGLTVVTVANDAGEPDRSPTAIRILTLLQEQVR